MVQGEPLPCPVCRGNPANDRYCSAVAKGHSCDGTGKVPAGVIAIYKTEAFDRELPNPATRLQLAIAAYNTRPTLIAHIRQLEAEIETGTQMLLERCEQRDKAEADKVKMREALDTIANAAELSGALFEARVIERKDRLTWWAVNVLQDCVSATQGHASQALGDSQ